MNRFLRSAWGALLAAVVAALFTGGALAQTAARMRSTGSSPRGTSATRRDARLASTRTAESLTNAATAWRVSSTTCPSRRNPFSTSVRCPSSSRRPLPRWPFSRVGFRRRHDQEYLPELPAYADAITVRHLVHHTSGLRDYNTLLSIAGRRGDEAFDNLTVLRITARQKKLNFEPGAEYLYSNTGYTLLALIVERATGDICRLRQFPDLPAAQHGGHALPYGRNPAREMAGARVRCQGSELSLNTPNNERAGAGGVFTNVRDLLQWDENFYDARVGGPELVKQLQVPGTLNGGRPLSYAWGLQVGTYRGLPLVEHSGSLGGYRAHLFAFRAAFLGRDSLQSW